jgi:4-amino-4-deoxy-L-arabinose transferase-like glycosyltransferase
MFPALRSRLPHYALLLTVAAALTLPNLGAPSLWDIDEGLNAEASREMLESGNWIVPTFNGQPRTAKPALLYWLQVASYRRFGVTEFAARLPSALAAFAAVLLTYELGRRMFGAAAGLLAGIIVISCLQVCVLAHAATPDALLLACLMLAFLLFWEGYAAGGRRWLVTTSLGTGLAALAKGPVGLALPSAVVVLFLLSRRELRRLCDWRLGVGCLVFAAVALPWYVLVGSETRGAFLRGFLWNENVNRFLAPMERHAGPVWFYLPTLLVGFTPWCVFLGPVVWDAFGSRGAEGDRTEPVPSAVAIGSPLNDAGACRFLLIWLAVWVGFFSLAQTKLPNYVLPAYPALALLTGRFLDRWRRGDVALPGWVMPLSLAALVLVGAATAAGVLLAGGALPVKGFHPIAGLAPWALLGLVPVAGAAAAWRYLRDGRPGGVVAAVSAAAVAFVGGLAAFPALAVEADKAAKPLVADAGALRPDEEVRVGCFDYFQPSLVFYCQREVRQLDDPAQALEFLRCPLPVYLFCPAERWRELESRAAGPCRLVARRHDLYRNCDVVVVTNR